MGDAAYLSYEFNGPQLRHHYGPNVHLLADPVLLLELAKLCHASTVQPEVSTLVRGLYQQLTRYALAQCFPKTRRSVTTRMASTEPQGVWEGLTLDTEARAVTVAIARAGTLPSQAAFELLCGLVKPDNVRQDHIYMSRVTNDKGAVVGVSVAGSKIGGDVKDATVLFPDPMGATGGSMAHTIAMYKKLEGGPAKKLIAMHLIVTPEYLKHMTTTHPDVVVVAARLDRGLSPTSILNTELGAQWDQERGLNNHHYIVPGAGGLGELLNNSYV